MEVFNIKDLKEKLNEIKYEFSKLAVKVMTEILDDFYDNEYYEVADGEIIYEAFEDKLFEGIDDALIYYADSWDYLIDQKITDFSDAIGNGCSALTSIAAYYLEEELMNFWDRITKE